MTDVQRDNQILFRKMSVYLNCEPRFITQEMMEELTGACGLPVTEAYGMILASAIGLDIAHDPHDRALYERCFPHMLSRLDPAEFRADPYLQTVRIPERTLGKWELRREQYTPYEAFVCDDPVTLFDGRVIPQIGFFEEPFFFPAVLEEGREWMLITPNEIRTMRAPIAAARGRVLTYGLGLGYFAFMAARKQTVESVTVVEQSESVIALFEDIIRPRLPCADKITVIQGDAYEYAATRMGAGGFDLVFADIWHDPSDGVEAYRRLKACEANLPTAEYFYWIEKTLRLYL